jgi:hypothetical protein
LQFDRRVVDVGDIQNVRVGAFGPIEVLGSVEAAQLFERRMARREECDDFVALQDRPRLQQFRRCDWLRRIGLSRRRSDKKGLSHNGQNEFARTTPNDCQHDFQILPKAKTELNFSARAERRDAATIIITSGLE